jgi:sugar O-acyltransferase (sialic acid O-acetyltransferase NeuD family)
VVSTRIKKVVILGASGASLDILSIIEDINQYNNEKIEFIGFLEDNLEKVTKENKKFIIGSFKDKINVKDINYITAFGNENNFYFRDKIIKKLEIPLKKFTNIIHPNSLIHKSSKIGVGNVIHALVTISRNTKLGNHCVILPKSTLSHDSVVGSYTIISTNVVISGFTKIGNLCYLGAGCILRDRINIESKTLIGMGSIILRNTEKESIYVGNPGKLLRKININKNN